MSEWTIYSRENVAKAVVHELEYHGEWMKDEYVTVTVKSEEPVDFTIGDYLVYRDEQFAIDYDTSVIKQARSGSYGEAFVYENIKLYSAAHSLGFITFKDYVLNDNGETYSSQAKFSFFAADVEDLADRIQANLDKITGASSADRWYILTPNSSRTDVRLNHDVNWNMYNALFTESQTSLTDKNVSCDSISCKRAIELSYEIFGVTFFNFGRFVVIGGTLESYVADVSQGYVYGKGNGLSEIQKVVDESQEIVTRLYAYGSSDNIPLNYYAYPNGTNPKTCSGVVTSVTKDGADTDNPSAQVELDVPFSPNYFNGLNSDTYDGKAVKISYENTVISARADYVREDNGSVRLSLFAFSEFSRTVGGEINISNLKNVINSLQVGGTIVFTEGVDKNAWPIRANDGSVSLGYLSICNLMLPGFNKTGGLAGNTQGHGDATRFIYSDDPANPYIESRAGVAKYGVREGVVYFDGSGDEGVIRPSIENTGADVVTLGSTIEDNGYLANAEDISFKIRTAAGMNWEEAWENKVEDIYIEMKTGYCAGRRFRMVARPQRYHIDNLPEQWILKLEREHDTSLDRYFPYKDTASGFCQVSAGDRFVATGLQMPSAYVEAASIRLLDAAQAWLTKHDHERVTFIPKIDEIFAAKQYAELKGGQDEHGSIYYRVHPGVVFRFSDQQVTGGAVIAKNIDSVTIKENGNNGIPTFDIVLRDEKDEDLLARIRSEASVLGGGSGGSGIVRTVGGATKQDMYYMLGEKVDCAWFSRLFVLKLKTTTTQTTEEGGEPVVIGVTEEITEIDPNDWPSMETEQSTDEETHITTTVTKKIDGIEAKYGLWTEHYISALGKNDSGGGGGGGGTVDLNEPLASINDAQLGEPQQPGVAIMWNGMSWTYQVPGGSGGGGGTVTSVGLSMPDGFSVGEPVTGSGTLEVTFGGNIAANRVLASPNGAAGAPSWRALVSADIPNLPASKITNGTFAKSLIPDLSDTYASVSSINDMATKEWVRNQNYVDQTWIGSQHFATQDWISQQGYMTIAAFENLFNALNSSDQKVNHPYSSGVASIKAMVGLWTEQYISALGKNASGSGSVVLNEPLESINSSGLAAHPSSSGQTIVWNGSTWVYGTAGGGSITAGTGLTGGTSTGTISISSEYLTKINHGESAYTALSNVYTKSEADSKFVSIAFFSRLFQAYKSTTISVANEVAPNDVQTTINNLKIMVGTWTQQYVSALGLNNSGSSGGAQVLDDLLDVNISNPTAGQVLKYRIVNGVGGWYNADDESGVGTVTQVKLGNTAYNPVNGVVSLPAYPTTLPASDVPSWAKQSQKPSYTLDEVSDGTTRKLSNYLPLAGGTMTGQIVAEMGNRWVRARDYAVIRSIKTSGDSYCPVFSAKTMSGDWSIGVKTNDERLIASYATDANYGSDSNVTTKIYFPTSDGTLALLTDNVASATKLSDDTAYTAWGQTFFTGGKPKTISSDSKLYLHKPNANNDTGAVYLVYESNNGGIHLVGGGLYADTYVSALGLSDSGSDAFDETAMWQALGTNISDKNIALRYIQYAADGRYALKTDIPQLRTLTFTDGNGNTVATYNGSTDVSVTLLTTHNHDDRYVTMLGVSGDYLTWTKNGSANNLTVPYATHATRLAQSTLANGASVGGFVHSSDLIYVAKGGGNNCTDIPDVSSFGLISLKTASGYYGQMLLSSGGTFYIRSSSSLEGTAWKKVIDSSNWTSTINLSSLGAARASDVTTLQGYFTNGIANNADKLDGKHLNELFTALTSTNDTNLSVTVGGVTKTISGLYALRMKGVKVLSDNSYGDLNLLDGTSYSVITNYHKNDRWLNAPNVSGYWGGAVVFRGEDNNLMGQLMWNARDSEDYFPTRYLWWRARANTGWKNDWRSIALGDTDGNIYMLTSASGTNVNSDSAKLKFNSLTIDGFDVTVGQTVVKGAYRSPYIQAIATNSYGRKRLSVFQSNAANYTDAFNEVFTILPNGTVGINPPVTGANTNYNLDVNGYTKTFRLYLSDTIYLTVENGGVHVVGGGLYADTYVSALGLSDSGEPAFDVNAMWDALERSGNEQIHKDHLTSALNGYALTSQIPTSLKNPYKLTITVNGTATEYDGSVARSLSINTTEGAVTQIKLGTVAYNPTSGVVTLPAYPTTLPASDVSAWAKQPNRPEYNFSDIRGQATASQLPSIENLTNFSTRVYDATVTRTKNTVLAAPNGSNGAATFRALVAADIPSLSGTYVTLTGAQTISGTKTFSVQQAFTIATGKSPFTVNSTTRVANLNADLLDGAHGTEFYSLTPNNTTAITSGDDLNNYTTPGTFRTSGGNEGSSVASSLLNKPSFAGGFRMYVTSLNPDNTYISQRIISYAGRVFDRVSGSINSTNPWEGRAWRELAYTDSNVASATKLADNSEHKAWGRTFWINGQPVAGDVSGDMTGVGSFTSSGTFNVTGSSSSYSQGIRIHDVGTGCSIFFGCTENTGINATMFGITRTQSTGLRFRGPATQESTTLNDYMVIAYGGNVGIGTTTPDVKLTVSGAAKVTDKLYLHKPNANSDDGAIYLKYENDGVHVVGGGLYTDTYVSALGLSDSSSPAFDEQAMWLALAGSGNEQINGNHLTTALSPYALKTDIPTLRNLSWSYGSVTSASGNSYNGGTARSFVIPKNTSHLTNDSGFITSTALGSYVPLAGGTMTGVLTTPKIRINRLHSGSNTNGGIYYYDGTTDYLLIGQGSSNLWIGANETAGTHHTGSTYISSGSGETYVSRLVNGSRSNYKVLDTGNTYVSGGKGYINGNEITTVSGSAGYTQTLRNISMAEGDDYETLSGYTFERGSFVALNWLSATATENIILNDKTSRYITLLSFGYNNRTLQFMGSGWTDVLKYRHVYTDENSNYALSPWKTIAFTDSTVDGAKTLQNWYSSRPTSADVEFGDGALRTFKATSSMTTGRPDHDAHILHMAWDNNGGYDAEVAVLTSGAGIRFRGQSGHTWTAWKTVLDSSNYTTYTKPRMNQKKSISSAGWYRVANVTQYSGAFLITLYGDYNHVTPPTAATFHVSHGYLDDDLRQVGGCAKIGPVTRVRVVRYGNGQIYVDIYYSLSTDNQVGIEITPLDGKLIYNLVNFTSVASSVATGETLAAHKYVNLTGLEGIYEPGMDGYKQNPDFFGRNAVGFLMSNQAVNGDTSYKNWMYMDNYSGTDAGGTTAIGVSRSSGRMFVMRSDSNRTSWNTLREVVVADTTGNVGIGYGNNAASYKLDVNGVAHVQELVIGNIHITEDTINGGIHIANGGLSANTYVSALGVGQEGGTQGLDIDAMWAELGTPNSSRQIDSTHISAALAGYATQNWVTSTALSGYATQNWVNQQGFVKNAGVTSVGMSVPTGLRVNSGASATITSTGTFAITFTSGYSIPTTDKQASWDAKQNAISDLSTIRANASNGATAYEWGNHATAGYALASKIYDSTVARIKNTVLAAPNGSNGVATFRALVAADIPNLDAGKITSGTFSTDRIPNLSASKITSGTFSLDRIPVLTAAKLPDLSGTYATTGRVTTLEGYFTNGVAKSAAKLTTVSKTAWGQTYWTSGGVPTDISGSIEAGNGGGYIGGFDHIDLNTHGSLYGYGGHIDFYYNGANYYTSRIIEESVGVLSVRSPYTAGLLVGGYNGDYVQIGQIRIVYESSNNALRIENANNGGAANLYAMGAVSALGIGQGGSGSDATFDTLTVNSGLYVYDEIHCTSDIYGDNLYISNDAEVSTLYYEYLRQSSDMRLKDVVRMVDMDVETIGRAPLFEFRWKSRPNTLNIGTSAQYWKAAMPQVVGEDRQNYLSMDYATTALAGVISVARKVMTHEEEIAALKRRIGELENEIETLKAA